MSDPTPINSPNKHHSVEADELDWLCRKLSDVRVQLGPNGKIQAQQTVSETDDLHLCDVAS
jgi:hypothetical protein